MTALLCCLSVAITWAYYRGPPSVDADLTASVEPATRRAWHLPGAANQHFSCEVDVSGR